MQVLSQRYLPMGSRMVRTCSAWWLVAALGLQAHGVRAQDGDKPARAGSHQGRTLAAGIGGGALIAGSLIALDHAWYRQYERGHFRFFNDGREWQGMDKAGHVFATYTVGEWGHTLLRWCGVRDRAALWAGGMVGLVYLTGVEYLDGRSVGWGFSCWDMAANAAGTGLYIGQELAWGEQRLRVKYSARLSPYAAQRPSLLGDGLAERILKDYNGATVWLSVPPALFGCKAVPPWFALAVGYGAGGMLGAEPAPGQYRQFLLAPDLDLTRLPVKGDGWRALLKVLNCVKVPLPALEVDSRGRWFLHPLYF